MVVTIGEGSRYGWGTLHVFDFETIEEAKDAVGLVEVIVNYIR